MPMLCFEGEGSKGSLFQTETTMEAQGGKRNYDKIETL